MRLVLAVVRAALLLLLVATALEAAPPAQAAPAADAGSPAARLGCRIPRCYAAISVNPWNGKWGVSYNQPTRHRAVARAQQACRNHSQRYRPHCEKLIWTRNGCAAAAYRVRNGTLQEYGAAYARYQGAAKSKALRKVRGPGHRHIWTWVCTSRRYGRAVVGTAPWINP
ncbi:DUF4189 domain-containing protein [Nocardioides panacisoli]|uniref:DUF4189 domain-containing protein n=1 Tax=Nocardioides panacisoli TaxID=627624 RepID=A0ABP7ICR0_9ACTN